MTVIINGSSGITNVNGTAAAPAETGTDTDSGIVYGTNTVSLATNGTTALTVDASQNIGIGTASPTSFGSTSRVLQVQSADATGYGSLLVGSGTYTFEILANQNSSVMTVGSRSNHSLGLVTNDTVRATIDTSGNVGIGTTAPNRKLEVSDATDTQIRFTGTSTANGAQLVGYSNSDAVSFGVGGSTGGRFGATLSYIGSLTNVPMLFMTNSIERMRIDTSGNLLVGGTGTTPVQSNTAGAFAYRPTAQLEINGNATQAAFFGRTNDGMVVGFYSGGTRRGSVDIAGATTSYVTSSDYRLKENIAPMTGALTTVSQLKPVTYKWKENGKSGQGFIAHELQAVVSDCVTGKKDAVDTDGNPVYQGIDTSFLVATLTAAIQELKALTDAQASTITALTARITALENK